jgi:hypothetical protein
VAIIALCQISTMKTLRNPAKNDPNCRLWVILPLWRPESFQRASIQRGTYQTPPNKGLSCM